MPSKPAPDRFLNYAQVAEMIGVDIETLRKGKCQTHEIPRIRLSHRKVVFSFNAVQAWMKAKAEKAERDRMRSQSSVVDLLAEKSRRQRAIEDTLKTIINGGHYR